MDTLYVVDVPQKEYIELYNDMARMTIVQFSIQLLLFATDPSQFQFFTADFFLLVIYILLGVALYHLVFKKVVQFLPKTT
jgi:hypothetical protein